MKAAILSLCVMGSVSLSGCTLFYSAHPEADAAMQSPKPLVQPVGKNWQILEEPPQLSDERGRLPFQTEQSVQPEGATKPVVPGDNRSIGTKSQ